MGEGEGGGGLNKDPWVPPPLHPLPRGDCVAIEMNRQRRSSQADFESFRMRSLEVRAIIFIAGSGVFSMYWNV
jgi:hypothetical protein